MVAPEQRLADIYDAYAVRVHAYAVRHCGANEADDVVAETFAVAWRRLDVVPEPPIGWLILTARNVIRARERSARRLGQMTRVLTESSERFGSHYSPGADDLTVQRSQMLNVLADLSEREREALLLTAWDGLGNVEAAQVAGCSVRAYRARLMRARARIADVLTDQVVDSHIGKARL